MYEPPYHDYTPYEHCFVVQCCRASSASSFMQSCHAQVILGWRSLEGGWLQRVVTQRLSTTGSLQTVLSGTDWGLAAVMAGKRWVKQAQAKGAAQDRRAAQGLRKQIGSLLLLMCCSHCCCCCWCQCVKRGPVRLTGTCCLRLACIGEHDAAA